MEIQFVHVSRRSFDVMRRISTCDRKGNLAKIWLICGLGDSFRNRGSTGNTGQREHQSRCHECPFAETRRKEGK
ncbi:hypothetical protein PsorP6_013683 [Peronosclerospora sorghi]|uniref:Uncharacterized protein n=1 Tax=Peronosclerospora sorghi TaxID=230839 RepID=A0ACC0VGU3_9STRA|nr:hypothetical protein PsorP6_013683 [Peronosclerospora sorghi]